MSVTLSRSLNDCGRKPIDIAEYLLNAIALCLKSKLSADVYRQRRLTEEEEGRGNGRYCSCVVSDAFISFFAFCAFACVTLPNHTSDDVGWSVYRLAFSGDIFSHFHDSTMTWTHHHYHHHFYHCWKGQATEDWFNYKQWLSRINIFYFLTAYEHWFCDGHEYDSKTGVEKCTFVTTQLN